MLAAVSVVISMPTMLMHNVVVPDLDPMPRTAPTITQTRTEVVGMFTAAQLPLTGDHQRPPSLDHLLPRGSTPLCRNSACVQTIKVPRHHGHKARADLMETVMEPTTAPSKGMWQASLMEVVDTDGRMSKGGTRARAKLTASGCDNSAMNAMMTNIFHWQLPMSFSEGVFFFMKIDGERTIGLGNRF